MIDDFVSWLGPQAQIFAVAILTGVVGFIGKTAYDIWLGRRKDKLERVNRQLRELYGPLLSLAEASSITWDAFAFKYCNPPDFTVEEGVSPLTPNGEKIWRHWMQTVFMPLNENMAQLVVKQADLLEEEEMPKCLRLLCAHVHGYKGVMAAWQNGDYSQHMSLTHFPGAELDAYARARYRELKTRQARLLGGHKRIPPKSGARTGLELLLDNPR